MHTTTGTWCISSSKSNIRLLIDLWVSRVESLWISVVEGAWDSIVLFSDHDDGVDLLKSHDSLSLQHILI